MSEKVKGARLIINYMSYVFILIGIMILFPVILLFFYPDNVSCADCFILPGGLSLLIGIIGVIKFNGKEKADLRKNDDVIIVLLTWFMAIFIGAIPFIMNGMTFTNAVFETTGGITGAAITIIDVDNTPEMFLLYRSILLFTSGVGFILIITSAISKRYGMKLYNAEGHSDKLMPNLADSARTILGIYLGYIIGGTVLYMLCGMNCFDAVNHSIAATATGGFSTRNESIGYYDSFSIEIVSMILMILGSTSFMVNLFLLKGKFKMALMHCETKLVLFILAVFTPIIAFLLASNSIVGVTESVRVSLFHIISILTTTGFQTIESFAVLPSSIIFLLILLMFVGGGVGSTAGGIKQARVALYLKSVWWNIKEKFNHSQVIKVHKLNKFGKKEIISEDEERKNTMFVSTYFFVILISTFILCLYGYDIQKSFFEVSSAIGSAGVTIGIASQTAPLGVMWTLIVDMFIGRLEIYIVIIGIAEIVRRIKYDRKQKKFKEKVGVDVK